MLGKALEFWRESLWLEACREFDGPEVKRARQRRVGYEQHRRALIEDEGEAPAQKIDEEVRSKLEMRIRKLGDDGLLEYLAGYFDGDEPAVDGRARTLAEGLLDRRLYKRAAQATGRSDRSRIFDHFGSPEKRRDPRA